MIYVKVSNIDDYACYTIYNENIIRAYVQTPQINRTTDYTDFFINSHYLSREGQTTWGSYSTYPNCINKDQLTNEFWYRNDLSDILISFMIMSIFIVYLPFKIFSRLFGRWLKI